MQFRLAKILLLILTLSCVIMPIQSYAHGMPVSTHDMHEMGTDNQQDNEGEATSCDHCCHFSCHSLGILRTKSNFVVKEYKSASIFLSTNYTSYNQAPPYHPPIA
ncbi:MAG: hypothetical protein DHS20C09_06830 [marine bacterium B5-7]|nr:MAG: hypothetical protein DHS20C09_06830 [marine bacterium B5-7]